jgi:hypothetical protein
MFSLQSQRNFKTFPSVWKRFKCVAMDMRAARWDIFVNDAAKPDGRKQTEGEEQGRKVKEMRVKETKPNQTQPNPARPGPARPDPIRPEPILAGALTQEVP